MRDSRIIISAGLFWGLGAAAWTLLEFALGWHNQHLEVGAKTGFIALIFPIAAILWALSATKRAQKGQLTVKQAMVRGLAVSAVSALIGVIFFSIYYHWINPAFLVEMRARGQPVDVPTQLISVVIGSLVVGFLLSVAGAALLRSKAEKPQ